MIENFNAKYVSLHVRKKVEAGVKGRGGGGYCLDTGPGLPWLLEKTPEVGIRGEGAGRMGRAWTCCPCLAWSVEAPALPCSLQ